MPKRSVRNRLLTERKSRPDEACIASSLEIQRRFLQSSWFQHSDCLALYSAIHNEVRTDKIFSQSLDVGKILVYPRVKDDDLEFVEVLDQADLAPGPFGVLEPQGDRLVSTEDLDLIVVPGVAFDRNGHRLGYGRGFYDRALALCRSDCVKVGFAYDFQLLGSLPVAQHDQKLSVLMTESCVLDFAA
jgi:5-formyltetrahydrofolate cyclo-ligase